MYIKIVKIGVTAKGKDISVGEYVETDEASAKSLIADGYAAEDAETVAKNAQKRPAGNGKPSGDKVPGQGDRPGQGGQTGTAGTASDNDGANNGDAIAKVKKALDSQYKRDEIYEAAVKAGVEIAFDAVKREIIDAIITQGKAEALLKK